MLHKYIFILFGILIIVGHSCIQQDPYERVLPDYFPELKIPDNNPLTLKKVELGELLFNDSSISIDSTISCASCHKTDFALADSIAISPGIYGRLGDRNSPSLFNVAFSPLLNKDGGVIKLDIQALIPIEDHNEMGISIIDLSKRLAQDSSYVNLFQEAFNQDPNGFTIPRALSSYVRTLIDATSAYDRYLQGNMDALSQSAKRGMDLFLSDRLACSNCHTGPFLTHFGFENNGLYQEYNDLGRALITLQSEDQGKFRVPSLRNVMLTAPYMHDGSLLTIEEVIDHYVSGGHAHPNQSPLVKGFQLDDRQRYDLISFLESLTSEF